MCCLSNFIAKIILFCGVVAILGFGAGLIYLGVFISDFVYVKSEGYEWIGYIIIGTGAFMILLGIIGIFIIWKKQKLFLSILCFFWVIMGILAIAAGGGILFVRQQADDWLGSSEDCLDNFENADKAVLKGANALCEVFCPCDASASAQARVTEFRSASGLSDYADAQYMYNGDAESILKCIPCQFYDDVSIVGQGIIQGFVQGQLEMTMDKCYSNTIDEDDVIDNYFDDNERKYLDLLTWIEEEFSCAGLCTQLPFYLFSDINDGVPDGNCYEELKDWIDENFLSYGVVCLVAGIILILETIFACCLCCRKEDTSK